MMNAGDDRKTDSQKLPAWLVLLGGIPLLAAMAVEFAGVILRNAGWPIPGSIELVEACVLLSSSVAIVLATLSRSHAKVRVLLNRARGASSRTLHIANAAGGAVFFFTLVVGGIWVIADLWGAAEHSETLKVPYMPLRIFSAVCMLATAAIYAGRVVRGEARE